PLDEAARTTKALANKFPSGKIDRDQLSPHDRAVYDSVIRTTWAPARREQLFIRDLEGLKNLARAADLTFQTSKKDAVDSGGDFNAIGQTLSKMLPLDKRTSFGLVILAAVAKDFPSEWLQLREQMAKFTDLIDTAKLNGRKK